MLNIQTMIESAREALGWPYVSPGSNNAQGIDCSGLFVKMYRDQGATIYHGSNRIFRKYCSTTGKLTSPSQLIPGMAVFKWKDQQPKGYDDDLGDFSHIGFVAGINPIQIIHASSAAGCVTIDDKINKWAYWGRLKDVDYLKGENTMPDNENENAPIEQMTAVVYAENGRPVKMRAKPTTTSGQYVEIPSGTTVEVLDAGENWCKIKFGARIGYMMTKFLKMGGTGENASSGEDIVSVSSSELKKVYQILERCLGQFIVSKADVEKAYDLIGNMLGLRG